jgi:hypothetical protein
LIDSSSIQSTEDPANLSAGPGAHGCDVVKWGWGLRWRCHEQVTLEFSGSSFKIKRCPTSLLTKSRYVFSVFHT